MKKLFFLAFSVAILLVTSCSKDTVEPVDLSGTTFTGTANVPGLSLSDKVFVLTFNADGTLDGSFTNGSSFALDGTWNLTPNSTTVHLFFTLASVSGTYVGQATLTNNNKKLDPGSATNATTPSANLNFTASR